MSIHPTISHAAAFPASEVESCIRDALSAEQAAQQLLRPRAASACEPEVDSLVVIEVICAIEELLNITLPTSFAPCGGYDHVEVCVADLVAQTRAVWNSNVQQEENSNA